MQEIQGISIITKGKNTIIVTINLYLEKPRDSPLKTIAGLRTKLLADPKYIKTNSFILVITRYIDKNIF